MSLRPVGGGCGPTYQIVHVSSGEHVGLHVGVLVQERVQQQRGLVGPLMLAQRCVQAVEVDLERVRLLRGRRRRVCARGGRDNIAVTSPLQPPSGRKGPRRFFTLPCVFRKQVIACRYGLGQSGPSVRLARTRSNRRL